MGLDVKGCPIDARVFPLVPGTKLPGTAMGHLDAEPIAKWEFALGDRMKDYGIALGGQFLVVDVDDPDRFRDLRTKLFPVTPKTWGQYTRRGWHWLYRVPAGYKGTNRKLPDNCGDIKCNGYIVGPGSVVNGYTYTVINSQEPADAPEWLLDLCRDTRPEKVKDGLAVGEGLDEELQIKEGEGRNQFLTRSAGSLRGLGLGIDQVKEVLRSINERVCTPALSEVELRNTVFKSLGKWEQGKLAEGELDGPFNTAGWISAADVPIVRPPISWWEWGFIPKGVLTLVFGRGGIGKSTLAAWVAGKVTQSGGRFGVVTREDPFDLFANRARLGGANPNLIWSPKDGNMFFPKDGEKLHRIVEEMKLDFLYFDSIYDHFEPSKDLHAGERARQSLSPLAKIASDTGCTIMGTFHTNKTGKFMGSTEMENVARVLLEASRGDDPTSPLTISVEKSNFKRPDFSLQFTIEEKEIIDPVSGEVQMEEQQDGTLGRAKLSFATKKDDIPNNTVILSSISSPAGLAQDLIVEFLGNAPASRAKSTEVRDFVLASDISQSSYERAIKLLLGTGEIEAEGPDKSRYYKLV